MVSLVLKDEIEKSKIEALLYLLKTWNIEAEIKVTPTPKAKQKAGFTLAAGLWENHSIDAAQLRTEAWKRAK
jgi:hypothetical protein